MCHFSTDWPRTQVLPLCVTGITIVIGMFRPIAEGRPTGRNVLINKCIWRKKHPYDCFTNLSEDKSMPMTAL